MTYGSQCIAAHPIDHVLNSPSASTPSLTVSSCLSRQPTYSVKVHPRQRHSTTDLDGISHLEPLATPRPHKRDQDDSGDTSHIMKLRRDPSVASLLDMYDEHGQLPSQAFSNSPTKEGRAQAKRSGSTLRQLLGESTGVTDSRDNSTTEGDISWAERYLAYVLTPTLQYSFLITFILQRSRQYGIIRIVSRASNARQL